MNKYTLAAVARFVVAAIGLVNIWLTAKNLSPIQVDEGVITNIISWIVSVLFVGNGLWKNNNFTKEAISAQGYLDTLKNDKDVDENKLSDEIDEEDPEVETEEDEVTKTEEDAEKLDKIVY